MSTLENKLKTANFWLNLGAINHAICLVVLFIGCSVSSFSCQGDAMKSVLSIYAFTIFTPQVALEMILLLAIFLVCNSLQEFRDNKRPLALFILSLIPLIIYATA